MSTRSSGVPSTGLVWPRVGSNGAGDGRELSAVVEPLRATTKPCRSGAYVRRRWWLRKLRRARRRRQRFEWRVRRAGCQDGRRCTAVLVRVVGLPYPFMLDEEDIESVLVRHGDLASVEVDRSGTSAVVEFFELEAAAAASRALHNEPLPGTGGGHIYVTVIGVPSVGRSADTGLPSLAASTCVRPGITRPVCAEGCVTCSGKHLHRHAPKALDFSIDMVPDSLSVLTTPSQYGSTTITRIEDGLLCDGLSTDSSVCGIDSWPTTPTGDCFFEAGSARDSNFAGQDGEDHGESSDCGYPPERDADCLVNAPVEDGTLAYAVETGDRHGFGGDVGITPLTSPRGGSSEKRDCRFADPCGPACVDVSLGNVCHTVASCLDVQALDVRMCPCDLHPEHCEPATGGSDHPVNVSEGITGFLDPGFRMYAGASLQAAGFVVTPSHDLTGRQPRIVNLLGVADEVSGELSFAAGADQPVEQLQQQDQQGEEHRQQRVQRKGAQSVYQPQQPQQQPWQQHQWPPQEGKPGPGLEGARYAYLQPSRTRPVAASRFLFAL